MPLYQYTLRSGNGKDAKNERNGAVVVELVRPVARRDAVPKWLKRIPVPEHIGILGTGSTPRDPHSADAQVPKAFRQLEEQQHGRAWLKETGFTAEQVRKTWEF